jgi:regulator of protease activity HflC (stomatin/prohibitin superfamily)
MFEESAKLLVWVISVVLLAVIILPQMIRILREYERGVIFRLGKLLGTKGPRLIFLIPIVDRMVRMDLRVVTIDVARQELMTRDNVPMTVDAVVYFRVIDPAAAVVRWRSTSKRLRSFRRQPCAACSDRRNSMNCSPNATRLISGYRRSSIGRRNRGESK